jgi:ABC-type anion transport system duplicated permease subunit
MKPICFLVEDNFLEYSKFFLEANDNLKNNAFLGGFIKVIRNKDDKLLILINMKTSLPNPLYFGLLYTIVPIIFHWGFWGYIPSIILFLFSMFYTSTFIYLINKFALKRKKINGKIKKISIEDALDILNENGRI